MPKKEPVLRYKDLATPAVATRATVVSTVSTDHGGLSGLSDDDHPQYAAIAQAETVTGGWTVSGAWTFSGNITLDGATIDGITPSAHASRHLPNGADPLTTAAPDADSVDVAASSEGSAYSFARSDHTHNLDEGIAPTWTAGHTFQATMSTYDVLPGATDSYDLGSSTYWYSQMFVSQINAAVFAEEQIALLGGWLYVSHDAGTFAAEVGAADATIDFGKAMTVSDFVVVKAPDKSGTVKTEYIQVGALSAGTVYNVTRDLAAAHNPDPNWAAGTPFAVLGQTGDGRIELNAYDAPRIQIIVQDDAVTYSNTTEYLRLGEMNGAFGSDAADEWGFGVGDYSGGNFVAYNTTDGFELKAGDGAVRLDTSGIRLLETGAGNSYISWKETDYSGDTIAYMTTTWDGGGADPINFILLSYKATGMSAGDAVAAFGASDVDAGTTGMITFISDGDARLVERLILNGTANANMTQGITIQQTDNDDEILALKSSDVGHGAYGTEADTYFTVSKAEAAAGGAALKGYKDSDGDAGAALQCTGFLDENADTTKSTAGRGIVEMRGLQTSSGSLADTVADGNVLAVITRRGGSLVTVAIVDEDGDLHLDGSNSGTFDEEEDALAVRSLAQGLAGSWNEGLRYNFERLRELGVISGGDREHPFVSRKNLDALMMGAIGQLYERLQAVERAVA